MFGTEILGAAEYHRVSNYVYTRVKVSDLRKSCPLMSRIRRRVARYEARVVGHTSLVDRVGVSYSFYRWCRVPTYMPYCVITPVLRRLQIGLEVFIRGTVNKSVAHYRVIKSIR